MPDNHMKWKDARRVRAVELDDMGWEVPQIAEALDAGESTVYGWLQIAKEKGVDALHHTYKKRAEKLQPEQWDELFALLERGALTYGFDTDCWTLPRISTMIQRHFGVSYHPGHLSRLMRAKGWSNQRPTKHDRRHDPEACTNWLEQQLPELEKKSSR